MFAKKKNIHRVFASDGPMRYNGLLNLNWTPNDYVIYLVEKDSEGVVHSYPLGQYTFLLFWEEI